MHSRVPIVQFQPRSTHNQPRFISPPSTFGCVVLESLNHVPGVVLSAFLDVDIETRKVQKGCPWYSWNILHTQVCPCLAPMERDKEGCSETC